MHLVQFLVQIQKVLNLRFGCFELIKKDRYLNICETVITTLLLRKVALKIFHRGEQCQREFRKEYDFMQKLNHDNIINTLRRIRQVTLYDCTTI